MNKTFAAILGLAVLSVFAFSVRLDAKTNWFSKDQNKTPQIKEQADVPDQNQAEEKEGKMLFLNPDGTYAEDEEKEKEMKELARTVQTVETLKKVNQVQDAIRVIDQTKALSSPQQAREIQKTVETTRLIKAVDRTRTR